MNISMMIGDAKIGNTKIIITDLRRNKIEVEWKYRLNNREMLQFKATMCIKGGPLHKLHSLFSTDLTFSPQF